MYNCYGPRIVDYSEPPVKDMYYAVRKKFLEPDQSAVAVYGFSSLFNHSCLSNCNYFDYGGFHVVRAMEHIPQGTQLMLNYVGETDYESRKTRLTALVENDFECACRHCREDREDGPQKRELRRAILKEALSKSAHGSQQNTQDKEKHVAEIRADQRHAEMLLPVLEQSYKDSGHIAKTELAVLYRHIGICSQLLDTVAMNRIEALKAVRYLELYLRHLGVVMRDEPITGPPIDALKKSAVRSMPKFDIQDAIATMLGLASVYGYTLKDSHQSSLWQAAGQETPRLAYAPSFEFFFERNKFVCGVTEKGLARLKEMDKERTPRG